MRYLQAQSGDAMGEHHAQVLAYRARFGVNAGEGIAD